MDGRFYHDTLNGTSIEVRIYFDNPSLFMADSYVSGHTTGPEVNRIRAFFEKWYGNKIRAIHFDQTGKWEQPVRVAARVDLAGWDTKGLYFYYYDPKTNKYIRLINPQYWIDSNGFLHFTTEYAGEIIISEGELDKR